MQYISLRFNITHRFSKGGISGSHTSAIVVMEQICQAKRFQSSNCTILSPDAADTVVNGVQYSSNMSLLAQAQVLLVPVFEQLPARHWDLPSLKLLIFVGQTYKIEATTESLVELINVKNVSIGLVRQSCIS